MKKFYPYVGAVAIALALTTPASIANATEAAAPEGKIGSHLDLIDNGHDTHVKILISEKNNSSVFDGDLKGVTGISNRNTGSTGPITKERADNLRKYTKLSLENPSDPEEDTTIVRAGGKDHTSDKDKYEYRRAVLEIGVGPFEVTGTWRKIH